MIRFGMSFMEMIEQLTKGYIKSTGKQPDNLAKIKIRQEALDRIKNQNKVVDMEGNVLDPSKTIMGGKQEGIMKVKPDTDDGISVTIDGKTQNMSPEGIIDVLNKKALMTKQKKGTPVTEAFEKEFNVKLDGDETFDELMEIKKTGKHPRRPEEEIELFTDERPPKDPEFAEGGRIGLKSGMTRRAFLALMGGVGTTIGALKSGIFSGFGKGAGKEVVKKSVSPDGAPPYFFDLVNKIKMFGKPKPGNATGPRQEVHSFQAKNGDEYELVEDLATGDQTITKDKIGGVRISDDEMADGIVDRTILQNKKGIGDEATKGTPPDEYEEMKVVFDQDGTMADIDNVDEVIKKEIIEEATQVTPPIKKAGGGLAYMLGE